MKLPVAALLVLVPLGAACGDQVVGWPLEDLVPPTVIATSPADGATAVPVDAPINVTFSEAMDTTSIDTTTFTLHRGAVAIPGVVTQLGVSAIFTPSIHLEPLAVYTATVSSEVMDLAGNEMLADHVWTFTRAALVDVTRPRVTAVDPAHDALGVALNRPIVVTFSEAMDPLTFTATRFTVHDGDAAIEGTISVSGTTATFDPAAALDAATIYTVTVRDGVADLAGNTLARDHSWTFVTGATLDTTRPLVIATTPAAAATGIARDARITATFGEPMAAASLTDATVTVMDGTTPVAGTVTVVGTTVVFTPTTLLDADTEYTVTIDAAATDRAGNALAADFVWTFTTGAALDDAAPTIVLVSPEDLDVTVALDAAVHATFSEAMSPQSLTTATFLVVGPGTTEVDGTVQYDAVTHIATFTPDEDLLPATTYLATITLEAVDLAGKALAEDYLWSFTTEGGLPVGVHAIELGSLDTFVAVAGAGLTNTNSSGTTTLNGDVGLSPMASCMGDGIVCTANNPVINGTLYANDPEGVAALAKVDLVAAQAEAMALPPGTTVADLSGMVLAPGVYTSGSTMSIAVDGVVTLDGQGDANAVWVFQIGSSLTVNNGAEVRLVNGARAKNVFWAVFASSTLGADVSFQGNILAGASNSIGTDSVVIGRLLCTTGAITLLSNTITLPPL